MPPVPGRWWTANPKSPEVASALVATTQRLFQLDSARLTRAEELYRLYGGGRLIGIRPWETPAALTYEERVQRNALRINVCKAAIDTVTAKVGKLRPRPTFLTNGGNYDDQLKAKRLQRFMDGAYHQSDAYEVAPEVFRDAMIFGTGVFHVYACGRRIGCERVPAYELFTDPLDALYGNPRRLYRAKWVSQECLEEWGIDPAEAATDPVDPAGATASTPDGANPLGYVRVVEAWCLPSEDQEPDGDSDDVACCGRRVLVVGQRVVEDEAWPYAEFPFVFVHWSKPAQGYWGDSALSEIVGIQVEINRLIQNIQESMAKVGNPWVFVKDEKVLSPARVVNGIGQVYLIDSSTSFDEALKVVSHQPVSQQVYQHVWTLYSKAFELLGSNQLAASATAPPGLESGRALERLSEEHSERFMTVSHHFEYCVGEALARQFIRVAKTLDEMEGGFGLNAPGERKVTERIRWKDVALDEDGYIIQVFPTSVLPTTPAARIDEVQRLSDAQWIDPAEARRLLNLPDLEASTDLATADDDNLSHQLTQMLDHGDQVIPVPYQDLRKALLRAQQSVLRGEADGVPESRLMLVRDYMSMVEALLNQSQSGAGPGTAPPQPGGAGGAVAPSGPMPGAPAVAAPPSAVPPGMPG